MSNAIRIERLIAERDRQREKVKKEIGYREQTFKCCETCMRGDYEDEGYVQCKLVDELLPASSICNEYKGGRE